MALTATRARAVAAAAATRPADTITSITVICPLRPDLDPAAARDLISELPVGVHSPFAISHRTHFARLQILDELCTDQRRPLARPVLVLSADVDGDAPSYLDELTAGAGPALAPVLDLCAGAPDADARADFARAAASYLLARWMLPVGLQYANSPGRTAGDVRRAVGRHIRPPTVRHRPPGRRSAPAPTGLHRGLRRRRPGGFMSPDDTGRGGPPHRTSRLESGVFKARLLREELLSPSQGWLAGRARRFLDTPDLADLQGNVLRAYDNDHAAYLFIEVDDPAAARRLLDELVPDITPATDWVVPPPVTTNVALSAPAWPGWA